ncbi:MAG: nicotinate (nicotinamide) nucleotide adenylyltransferase [Ignavibacteriae bacterium]|nr:nicotinate (nicotinamide) nucleotide adenylyltransferase [Ignavibacteriota bacterium]
MRVGIFGGTFNPVDNAHIEIAKQFVNELKIDICHIIPANISPFKIKDDDAFQVTNNNRIDMLKLAFTNEPKFLINTFEIDKGGISYSFETIKHIISKNKNSKIFVLIGSDQALNFKEWMQWEWILINTQICIAMREKYSSKEEIINSLELDDRKPVILNNPIIKISATEIRKKLQMNERINELVPISVENYIIKNKLYLND